MMFDMAMILLADVECTADLSGGFALSQQALPLLVTC